MFDLIKEIVQTLSNNKLRTTLTGFAVAWGIFMLIILLSVSRGVYNSFSYHAMSNGSKISIFNGYTSLPYKGLRENRFIQMRKGDMDAIARENSRFIKGVSGEITLLEGTISSSNDFISGHISGVYPDYYESNGLNLCNGRSINGLDMMECRKVIMISKTNAEILFDNPDNALGQRVMYRGLAFTVAGIYEGQGYNNCLIPFTTAMKLNGNSDRILGLTIYTQGIENTEQAQKLENNIRNILSRRHSFDPKDPSALWIWNQYIQQMNMLNSLEILNVAIWIIGILTLLTGIVGVSNIMFVSVRERTHEIGIRRAIGAKPHNILTQIILESVSITALFGYIGIFFGILITELLSVILSDVEVIKDPTIDISIAISVTVVLIIAGMLAGIFPALKALRIKPVEALRTE